MFHPLSTSEDVGMVDYVTTTESIEKTTSLGAILFKILL
jgi:hypothetical protein